MNPINQFMTNKIKSNSFSSVLFMIAFLGGYLIFGDWQKSLADSHKVVAKPEVCNVIGKPVVNEGNSARCEFEARLFRSPFASEYLVWVKDGNESVKHKILREQVISSTEIQ